jgi:branched-chain amino acid transport system substrate-binding protein
MRPRTRRTAATFLLVALAACSAPERGGDIVALGAILPLSGDDARSGACVLEGMRLAAKQDGLPLEIVARDASGSVGGALRCLGEFADEPRVLAVVGGWRAASGRPLEAAAAARGVPFVALSPLACPDEVVPGAFSLHHIASLATAAARFAREDLGARSAGIVRAPGGDACTVLAEAFVRSFTAGGGGVRWTAQPDTNGKIVGLPATGAKVDVVWIAGSGSLASRFAAAWPALHGTPIVLPEGWDLEGLDALAASGTAVRVVTFFASADADERTRRFVTACAAAGIVPTPAHALGWDFVNAIRDAAKAGGATREGILRAVSGTATFEGVTGRLALGGGPERPAISAITGDGTRLLRRVEADAPPRADRPATAAARHAGA